MSKDEYGRTGSSAPNVQRWPRGLKPEEIARMTPEQLKEAKRRWLRDYPELAAWFESQETDSDSF